jgi:transcriptional regulator with XRE-family HTH domain
MPRPTNLSRTLHDLRVRERLTQAEAADRSGFSESSIANWERGHCVPQIQTLRRLEEVYGLESGSLVELRRITLRRRVETNRRRANRHPRTAARTARRRRRT